MLPLVPPDSEDARTIRDNVEEARKLAGEPVARSDARAAQAHPGVRGTVRLSQKLRDKLSPGDTLFVYARAARRAADAACDPAAQGGRAAARVRAR